MVEVKNLTKDYGTNRAVDNLSLSIEEGRVYGLLGPNGAGKSTTMNVMTGYLAATSGEVLIDGYDIVDEPDEAKKRIGYMPETPPLYLEMTPREYLRFACELKRVPKEEVSSQVERVMGIVGVEHLQHRLIRNLSKGYRQRVGLAQAIIGDPKLVILDEPTVGLDPKQILEIRDVIRELGKNRTVILSSHILAEVSAICDYIFIIANGKLVASDTPENLKQHFQKKTTLVVSVKGEKETVLQALKDLPAELSAEGAEEEGILSVTLESEGEKDLREEVSFALGTARIPILGMTLKEVSLEDIFLEITGLNQGKRELDSSLLHEEVDA